MRIFNDSCVLNILIFGIAIFRTATAHDDLMFTGLNVSCMFNVVFPFVSIISCHRRTASDVLFMISSRGHIVAFVVSAWRFSLVRLSVQESFASHSRLEFM